MHPPIRVVDSVDLLLAGATRRQAMKTADSLSGSRFERADIDGEPFVVKHLCVDDDWLMRATGDLGCRQRALWTSPLASRIPDEIDHTVAAVAVHTTARGRPALSLLMHDVGGRFHPTGAGPLPDEVHLRHMDHMAALHAAFAGWHDTAGLMPLAGHYTMLTPVMSALESARGGGDEVPPLVAAGWERLRSASPRLAGAVDELLADPGPLVDALLATPSTLLHGDWKMGNLGMRQDGRTILVDWDRCGEGPGCVDLAWYLAVNSDLLVTGKEALADAYRSALVRRGVDVGGWWERQLALALVGGFLQLGWAKAGGDRRELGWWEERVIAGMRLL